MSDAYLLLTPLLMLGVLALVRFVGCNLVFQAVPDPIDAPQNVIATPGNQSVTLSWDPLEEATGYVIKQGEVPNEPNPVVIPVPDLNTAHTVQNLSNGTTYFFRVVGTQNETEGEPSDEVSATPALGLIAFKTLGTKRNNFTGDVGMVIQIGASALVAVGLGRVFVAGNSGVHRLRIADSVNGISLPGAEVTIDLAAAPAAIDGEFVYAIFPAPVILNGSTEFYVFTGEIDGGDQWFDQDTTVLTSNVATVTNAVSSLGATFVRSGGAGHTFGPVDVLHS
jgi:Fibronectin type III domain